MAEYYIKPLSVAIPVTEKARLKKLTPATYTGLSEELVD